MRHRRIQCATPPWQRIGTDAWFSGYQVTLDIEGVVDGGLGGNKWLGLTLGLEALHLSHRPRHTIGECFISD
jgi:hypothetical protein